MGNKPLTDKVTMDQMQEGKHFLEEADHQIVLHSIGMAQNDPETILDMHSLDTDVFVLLTAFRAGIPAATTLLRSNNEKHSIPSSSDNIWWVCFKSSEISL